MNFALILHKLISLVEYDKWIIIFGDVKANILLQLGCGIVLSLCIYWLFFVPFNWTKHLEDVSYWNIFKKEPNLSGKNKRDTINRLRRARKIDSRQLPPPYPNGWYGILESSKLQIGEATYVSCLGENFVVYRTQKQEVFVLDAYCPHLGANLGIGGRVVGDNIECPFHQWSFRGTDGVCTNVPYSTCVPQATKIRKWISNELSGFIFVWYHAESEEPWELPFSTEIQKKKFVCHGRNEFYVNCHIQEIPENGADLAHFTAIHNESIFAGGTNPKNSLLARAGFHHWQASWSPSKGNDKHLAEVTLSHSLEITKNFHCFQMNVTGKQIGPSYVQLHMYSPTLGDFQIIQTIIPIEPLLQKVVHTFYGPRWISPLMKVFIFGESVMFERDINMWNHKVYQSRPVLMKEDSSIKQFRNWYAQFYSANSKPFAEAGNTGW